MPELESDQVAESQEGAAEPKRGVVILLSADTRDEELEDFLAVLNEGMPEAN